MDLNLNQSASGNVDRARGVEDVLRRLGGTYKVECFRPDGSIRWTEYVKNGIADVGMNSLLDVYFRNQSQIAAWYVGLVDNASFSAFAGADTMGSHAGWIESTAYTEGNRQTWTAGAAAARSITNGTAMVFSINATATIKGIFVTSNNTKGGTTGTLWSTGAFAANQSVINGDTLRVTYTLSG